MPASNPTCLSLTAVVLLTVISGCSQTSTPHRAGPAQAEESHDSPGRIVARVNGEPIDKDAVMDVLYTGRGRAVLDELILLEIVRRHAEQKGKRLNDADTDAELELFLDDMAPGKSRQEKRALLGYMLRSRGITRAEFDIIVKRQSLLRRLVDPDVTVTNEMLADEHERRYGRRTQVRLLTVNSLRQIEAAQRRLNSGADFIELVGEMSQDQLSLARDGLLGPFSVADQDIPIKIRSAAAAMHQPGQLSGIIKYRRDTDAEAWCILQIDRILPADGTALSIVRSELRAALERRQISLRMINLQESLRTAAEVVILDPILRRNTD